MLISKLLIVLTGLSGGITVSAGIVALINVVGTVPRMAARTKTAGHIHAYEKSIVLGGTAGNLLYMCHDTVGSAAFFAVLFAFFSGVYIGCLLMALAETLQIIPIYIKHVNLKKGLAAAVICFAAGKFAGSMWYFFFFK